MINVTDPERREKKKKRLFISSRTPFNAILKRKLCFKKK